MQAREWFSLILLVLLSFFLMCDMFITPAIISELSDTYGVSDVQLSWVSSTFIIAGSAVGLGIGYLTDRYSRKYLLILVVLCGEVPCLLTGIPWFTESFTGFVVLRALSGIGIGGIYPLTFSLLSDYFAVQHRAKACAAVDLAWGLGTIGGPLLAFYAVNTDYGWRLAFILAALPNFPVLFVFYLFAKEPERGHTDSYQNTTSSSSTPVAGDRAGWKSVFQKRTNILLFLQGIPGSLPWGVFPFWLMVLLTQYSTFTRAESTFLWEVFGISVGLGGLCWAIVGDKVFARKPERLPLLCSGGILLGIIPCALVFNLQWQSVTSCAFAMILAGMLISVPSSNCKAMLMSINTPRHRGSVFSVYNLADNIGKGLGPAFGGLVLSVSGSYSMMANTALALWIFCGAMFALISVTIRSDYVATQTSVPGVR